MKIKLDGKDNIIDSAYADLSEFKKSKGFMSEEEKQRLIKKINDQVTHDWYNKPVLKIKKTIESDYEQPMQKASQLSIGTRIEAEHKDTLKFIKDYHEKHGKYPPEEEVYKQIARDHLSEFKDYYTRLIAMEKQAEKEMSKAVKDTTKLVKKVIINKLGKQQTVYVAPEKKEGWISGFMSFFNFKETKQVNQKLEADYKALELGSKGVTWFDWKDHVAEYFNNKDKWDKFFGKTPVEKKEAAKKEEKKAEKKDKKPSTAKFKLGLMKLISGVYGEKPKVEETKEDSIKRFGSVYQKQKTEIEKKSPGITERLLEMKTINKMKEMKNKLPAGENKDAVSAFIAEKEKEYNKRYGVEDTVVKPTIIESLEAESKESQLPVEPTESEDNFETMPDPDPEPIKGEKPVETGEETLQSKLERWKSGDLTGVIGTVFNIIKELSDGKKSRIFHDKMIVEKISNGFVSMIDADEGRLAGAMGFAESGFIRDLRNGSIVPIGLEQTIDTGEGSKIEVVKSYTPEQRKEVNNDAKEAAREGYYNEKPAEILNVGRDVWGAARHNFDTYQQLNADVLSMEKDGTAKAYVTKKNLFGSYGLANKDERVKAGETETKVLASFVVREYLQKIPPDSAGDRTKYMDFCRAVQRLDQNSQNASTFYFGLAEVFAEMFPVENKKPVAPGGYSILDMVDDGKIAKGEEIVGNTLASLFYSLNQNKMKASDIYYRLDKKERKQLKAMTEILLSETGKSKSTYNDIEVMIFGATKLTGIKMKKGDNVVFSDNLKDRVYSIRIDFASDSDKEKHDALKRESNLINQDSNFAYLSNKDREKQIPILNKKYGTNFSIEKPWELNKYLEDLSREKAREAATYMIRTKVFPEEKGQIIKVGKNDVDVAFKFPDGKIRAYRMNPGDIKPENVESISKEAKEKSTKRVNLYVESKVERKGGKDYSKLNITDMQNILAGDFQFKAVQYGNSMPDTERQYHTQWTLESMSDLAEITGLPLEQITARGKLGIAFGARGQGGGKKPGALAHYERSTKMINLTRANGYGSLAHEWAHFMDNALSPNLQGMITVNPKYIEKVVTKENIKVGSIFENEVRRGKKYVTDRYYYDGKNPKYPFAKLSSGQSEPDENSIRSNFYKFRDGIPITVQEPDSVPFMDKASDIAELSRQSLRDQAEKAIEKTRDESEKIFLKESILNDTYLNAKEETFARAFECYVSDKLSEMGRKNTYLASIDKTQKEDGSVIYPQGEFRKKINKMFDEFFAEIRKGDEMKKAIDNLLKQNKNVYIKKTNPKTGKVEYRKVRIL